MPIANAINHVSGSVTVDESLTNPTDPEDCFVLFSNASCVTGRNLADYLGVPRGHSDSSQREYLFRWGSTSGVRFIPDEQTFNRMSKIEANTDKYNSLRVMDSEGIQVPDYSRTVEDLSYPILVRSTNHREGQDINLILQERDDYLTSNDFYTQYIPVQMEYRVHVAFGNILKLYEKRLRSESDNHPVIRNSGTGNVFLNPRDPVPEEVRDESLRALRALGLEYGAVDVILGENDEVYVLEVNTAPSLDEANIQRYGNAIAERAGLEDIPGMSNVELEDDGEAG